MPKFRIFDIVGENCITMEDGEKVFALIFPELKAGNSVDMDFSGCKIFVSLFFNHAVGRLLKDFSADDLNRLLSFSNIDAVGKETIQGVIKNAKRYYSMDDATRNKIGDEILLQTIIE